MVTIKTYNSEYVKQKEKEDRELREKAVMESARAKERVRWRRVIIVTSIIIALQVLKPFGISPLTWLWRIFLGIILLILVLMGLGGIFDPNRTRRG